MRSCQIIHINSFSLLPVSPWETQIQDSLQRSYISTMESISRDISLKLVNRNLEIIRKISESTFTQPCKLFRIKMLEKTSRQVYDFFMFAVHSYFEQNFVPLFVAGFQDTILRFQLRRGIAFIYSTSKIYEYQN